MSDADKRWERWAQALADGDSLTGEQVSNDEEAEMLAQFAVLEQIAALHHPELVKPEETASEAGMFTWGQLKILERLDAGTYGVVYRAYDATLDRDVALKLLRSDIHQPLRAQAFLQEARRLAQVRHPHVLAVHGADVHDGRVGMWSDLISGANLSEGQTDAQLYDAQMLLQTVRQMGDALAAIHAKGIVHGDVKPANIMRDENQNLTLMDFGAGSEVAMLQDVGSTTGTPLLMAPEVLNGRPANTTADMYALGATLFKLASGRYPVEGDTLAAIRQAHRQGDLASLDQLRPDLPAALCQFIQALLHQDPESRPTARQAVATADWIAKAPRRRQKRWALTAVIGSLTVGLILSVFGLLRAEQQRAVAEQEQQKASAVNQFLQQLLSASAELGGGRDVRVADLLNIAGEEMQTSLTDQPHALADAHHALGDSYNALHLTDESRRHLTAALDLKKQLYPADSVELLKTELEYANALQRASEHEQAIQLLRSILDRAIPAVGADHRIVKLAIKHWVNNLYSLSRFQEGMDLLNKHFVDIPDPATASNNFGVEILIARANGLNALGKFEEALATTDQALQWLDAFPKAGLFNRATAMTLKSMVLNALNRKVEAEQTMQEVLVQDKKLYGENHEEVLEALSNLGAIQYELGWSDKAFQTKTQAYEMAQKLYGDEPHRNSVAVATNLANTLVARGELARGEVMMREALADAQVVLGNLHSNTLILEYNLAELLNNRSDFDSAQEWAIGTIERKTQTFGAEHPFTWLSKDNLAISLAGLQRFDEALDLHLQVVAGIKNAVGESHPFHLLVLRHHADTAMAANLTDTSRELLQQLLALQQSGLGEDHEDTRLTAQQLSRLSPASSGMH